MKFVLLHESKNDEAIRLFFNDVWELYVKVCSAPLVDGGGWGVLGHERIIMECFVADDAEPVPHGAHAHPEQRVRQQGASKCEEVSVAYCTVFGPHLRGDRGRGAQGRWLRWQRGQTPEGGTAAGCGRGTALVLNSHSLSLSWLFFFLFSLHIHIFLPSRVSVSVSATNIHKHQIKAPLTARSNSPIVSTSAHLFFPKAIEQQKSRQRALPPAHKHPNCFLYVSLQCSR